MIPLTKSLAASGTWNMDVDGTWEDNTSGVWLNNIVPEGAGSAANFDFDITADHTVTMNSNHTIGTLFFRDKTTSSNNWTLANGNSAVLTLDNNASSPVISVSNRSATISAPLAGTHGVTLTGGGNANLYLSGNNTYSGGTTINSTGGGNLFSVYTGSNTAFGTGDVHFNPGGSNAARMFVGGGLTVNNDIYLDTVRAIAGNNGAIMIGNFSTTGATVTVDRNVSATLNGTIRVAAPATSGGTFVGAEPPLDGSGNYGNAFVTNFLTFNGPIIFTTPGTSPKSAAGSGGNIIQHRGGNIQYGGGGSYYRLEIRSGLAQLSANNGLATNSYIDIGGNSNFNPATYGILNLNGFNQSLVGLSNYVAQGQPATVTNNSTTTASTLTLVPANPTSNPNQANLWFTAGGGAGGATSAQAAAIINVSPNAPLNLVVNGDAAGTQYLTTPANGYTGTTTLTSGTLAISSLTDGGTTANMITTAGSLTATVDTTAGLAVGQLVESPNVRTYSLNGGGGAPTTITAIDTGTNTITLSVAATAGDGATPILSAFGAGNGLGISSNSASNLVFDGGKLSYVLGVPGSATTNNTPVNFTGVSATPSTNRNFTINPAKTGTIDVQNGTTTTVLTMSGGSANTSGSLIKSGPGTLILSGANQHTGGTTVSGGTLLVNGSLSTGAVSVPSGSTLGGRGTIAGIVTPASGGILAPGSSVGTLSVGGLTLNSGSISNFEFNTTPANDQIIVTNPGGLTVNGGGINLYQEGTTTAFSNNGTYTLFNINGGFSGALSNFTISNPTAGKFYNLNNTASAIQLTIGNATTVNWNGNTSTSWSLGGNWVGGSSPNAVGTTVRFNGGNLTGAGSTTVAVDGGGKTASGIIFDDDSSTTSFNITGPGTLTLNNGVAAAAIGVNNGTQSITAPIAATNTLAIALANASALNLGGAISGAKPLGISGTGTLTVSGNNTHSSTTLNAATPGALTLNIGAFGGSDTSGTLGSGDLTMSGGAVLNFNRSNAYNFVAGITGSGANAGTLNQLGTGTTTVTGPISNVTTVNVSAGGLTTSSTISQSGGINVTGGSLTANGAVSGAGALTVNTSGTVSLNAANTYSGGTTLTSGNLIVNAAGALPASSSLTVNGGLMDLRGNSISLSNIGDTTAGGVITNNGPANSTSTITFVGSNSQDYDLYAALNNGTGKIAVDTSITNLQTNAVPNRILHFHSTGTYTGGTIIHSQGIEADANNAFGTGPITVALNNSSTNWSQINVASGVTIHNDITIAQGKPTPGAGGAAGVIQQAGVGNGDSHVFGTITIQANNVDGGLFVGPAVGGTEFLNIHGPVNTAGTADTIIQRGGQVKYFAGGNYQNFAVNGLTQLAANNALSQSAVIQIGTIIDGTFDLGGFDQTAKALSATTDHFDVVQNSGAGPNTLTLNTSGSNTYGGTINGSINLTVAGNGTQILTGFNSYTGDTRVQSGTLSITNPDLADAADVYLSNGALFDLNFVGDDFIDSLFLGGTPAAVGTWGGPGSGATNISSLFSGTGTLDVQTLGTVQGVSGDYNNNGVVDAADYVLWRKGGPLQNDPTPGVQPADYDYWRSRFGATTGSGSGVAGAAVPEPASGMILLSLLAAVTQLRLRFASRPECFANRRAILR